MKRISLLILLCTTNSFGQLQSYLNGITSKTHRQINGVPTLRPDSTINAITISLCSTMTAQNRYGLLASNYAGLAAAVTQAKAFAAPLIIPFTYRDDSTLTLTSNDSISVWDYRSAGRPIFNGIMGFQNHRSAPSALTNGVWLYVEDVGGSAELKAKDEAGNVTVLTDLSGGGGGGGGGGPDSVIYKNAMAWYAPPTNGPDITVLNSREEAYAFDPTTAETLYTSIFFPKNCTVVDSAVIIISVNSTAGDSSIFTLGYVRKDNGTVHSSTVGDAVVAYKDMGGSANVWIRMNIALSFAVASNERDLPYLFRLYRTGGSNNVNADVNFHDFMLYYH